MWPAFFVVHFSWRIIGLNRKKLAKFYETKYTRG